MSLRVRLILMNAIVMSLALIGVGFALAFASRAIIMRNVERDLIERAHGFVNASPPDFRNWIATGRSGGPNPMGRPNRGPQSRPNFFDVAGRASPTSSHTKPLDPVGFERAKASQYTVTIVVQDSERIAVASGPVIDRLPGPQFDELDMPDDPQPTEPRLIGVVQIERPLGDIDEVFSTQVRTSILLIPVALALASLAGWFMTARALKPVHDITLAASRITDQDLSIRLPSQGADEFGRLTTTFNGMLARLDSAFQRQRQFTDDASHELRTPIARIKLTASSTLAQESSPEEMRDALVTVDRAADAMSRLVQQLLQLARSDGPGEPTDFDRVAIADVFARVAETEEPRPGAKLRFRSFGTETVFGSIDDLTRVVTNLVQNARRFAPADSVIDIEAIPEGDRTHILVTDSGPGVPKEKLAELGRRFYRVDASRTRRDGGSGLGLAIVKAIVETHRGTVAFSNAPGRGLRVEIVLPAIRS